jgi:hypothetical protein
MEIHEKKNEGFRFTKYSNEVFGFDLYAYVSQKTKNGVKFEFFFEKNADFFIF